MKICLNGEEKILQSGLTLQQLLDELKVPSGRVACEVNLKIIKKAFYGTTPLNDGDAVEIIQAIGGG